MYEPGHSGGADQQGLREDLRRLEAALAVQEHHLQQARNARHAQGAHGTEMLAGTVTLLVEEIERVRRLLVY